jgi:excisionase family DNA binding protein
MILMDLDQAAASLHCSKRWLADNLRAGRFPAKKVGRKWVFSEEDINAILQICSVSPGELASEAGQSVAPRSSMTETTRRRLQQARHSR